MNKITSDLGIDLKMYVDNLAYPQRVGWWESFVGPIETAWTPTNEYRYE